MFDFLRFMDVAIFLSKIDDEAYVRSAIGRYYYSIFNCVRLYLIDVMCESEFLDNYRIHTRICDRLIKSNDETESSLGEKLCNMRKIRNAADYDWINFDAKYFTEQLDLIEKESGLASEQLKSLRNSPPFEL